jgi:hypothetical protein
MVPKKDSKVTKGMIFAGCSYVWGQGLYYYSNMETLVNAESAWGYNPMIVKEAHHKFKESVRYPRIVAKHFNRFELVHPKNGGANDQITNYWSNCFKNREKGSEVRAFHPGAYDQVEFIEYEDVSHVIFQLTHWMRDHFQYEYEGEIIDFPVQWSWDNSRDRPYNDMLLSYLEKNNTNLTDLNEKLISKSLDNVKTFLTECEERGIKTYILTYADEFLERLREDKWLSERWVTIDYEGKRYECIDYLLKEHQDLTIFQDYEMFDVPPNDSHPSLKCHKIIAQNIINFIENNEKNG